MEVRVALALCIVIGSALCGKAFADSVRRRVRTLDSLAEGLRVLKIHMTGMFEPVRNALQRTDCDIMALVASAMEDGSSAGEAWRRVQMRASRRGGAIEALRDEDRKILEQLFSQLGQSGREAQEALLAGVIQAVDSQREKAAIKAREADRLYLSLGLLIGLMLALIVI